MKSHWRKSVLRVLGQYAPTVDATAWSIKPFARGIQARLFRAQYPNCDSHSASETDVLVKLFKSRAGMQQAVENEYRGLELLNESIQASQIHGWRCEVPRPLTMCHDPLAIVMTRVSGQMLEKHFFQFGTGPEQWIDSLAQAISAGLGRYWNHANRQYGDLNLFNLLCDPDNKTVGFVDPGIPSDIFTCPNVSKEFSPASRDLGYLLFEISTENCQPTTAYLRVARRRNQLLLALLRHHIETNITPAETDSFIEEVAACINTHLGRIKTGHLVAGPWRTHVRRAATANVRRILTACCRPTEAPSTSNEYQLQGELD